MVIEVRMQGAQQRHFWELDDVEASRFLQYLKDRKLSVFSPDDLRFSYSVYRAQLRPTTRACQPHDLLHALRRIHAIKFWNDQSIGWITGSLAETSQHDLDGLEHEVTSDTRENSKLYERKGVEMNPVWSHTKHLASSPKENVEPAFFTKNRRQILNEREVCWYQGADQVDHDEEIVWRGRTKVDRKVDRSDSSLGRESNKMGQVSMALKPERVTKPSMSDCAEKSVVMNQGDKESYNTITPKTNAVPSLSQYRHLQQLFAETSTGKSRTSLSKSQQVSTIEAASDEACRNTDGDSKENASQTSDCDHELVRLSSQNHAKAYVSKAVTNRNVPINRIERNLIRRCKPVFNDGIKTNQPYPPVNDQAACKALFQSESKERTSLCNGKDNSSLPLVPLHQNTHGKYADRCLRKTLEDRHNLRQPNYDGHFEVNTSEQTRNFHTNGQPVDCGDECLSRSGSAGSTEGMLSPISDQAKKDHDQHDGSRNHRPQVEMGHQGRSRGHDQHNGAVKSVGCFAGAAEKSCFSETLAAGKTTGKGAGGGEKLSRNWMASQEIKGGDLFVSQPFSLNHNRPQTISIGGTETASISVVNNGKDVVKLWGVQMLYAKPMGSFALAIGASPGLSKEAAMGEEDNFSSKKSSNASCADLAPITSGGHKTAGSSTHNASPTSYSGCALAGAPWMLETSCHITFKLTCTAKEMGLHKAVILFNFGNQKIIRYVTLIAEDEVAKDLAPSEPFSRGPRPKVRRFYKYIVGRPPPLPTFRKPLATYAISEDVRKAVIKNETLPIFLSGLSMETYVEYFSSLMFTEELQMEADIRAYDMQNVTMRCEGSEFLVLKVPGLSERRPSVIYRDEIFIRRSGSQGKEYQGYVYRVRAEEVFLKFSSSFHATFVPNCRYDVRFSISKINFRRAHQAINASSNLPKELLFPYKSSSAGSHTSAISICPFNRLLNKEQKSAVEEIVKRVGGPPYLIYGPPGTGKTVTVVEAILQVLRYNPKARVLACAPSNSAADLLLERLMGPLQQREMLRLNAFTRPIDDVPPDHIPYCYCEGSFFCCPIQGELLKYKVIVSTYWSAAMVDAQEVRTGHFTHIFLDEAGQGMEPEAMVAVANLASPETVVILAGDHRQLGPIIRSSTAEKFGLGKSFLERMSSLPLYSPSSENGNEKLQYDTTVVTKLKRNYRSHPAILDLPSRLFYDGELIACAPEEVQSSLCGWDELPRKNFPVLFIGIEGRDEREGKSPSWFNAQEASKVIEVVRKLKEYRKNRVNNNDIGIISPYNQQVKKIKMALASQNMKDVKVGSVEQFQGEEKRVIIISTVRSSKEYVETDKHHNLGFLRNPKRFNVAVTRAKALLVIVGNPYVLCQDAYWNELLRYCILHKSYAGCSPPSEESAAEAKRFYKCMDELFPPEIEAEDSDVLFSVAAAVEETQWPDGEI